MSEELKPCPFCGTKPSGPDTGMVSCEDIGFKQIRTEAWNSAYCWKEFAQWKALAGELMDYLEHKRDCVLSFWEAGEPTPDGGYRTKYKGRWYQSRPIDETPKCDCGLDEALGKWREVK